MSKDEQRAENQRIRVECDGNAVGHADRRARWCFIAFDQDEQFVTERQGYYQSDGDLTEDEADFFAVKAGVLWAALDHPSGEIEVVTKSNTVSDWLRNGGTTQSHEIYRELYECGARTGEYSILTVPEEENRAVDAVRRQELVLGKHVERNAATAINQGSVTE